jgi:hypothetical protein
MRHSKRRSVQSIYTPDLLITLGARRVIKVLESFIF